MNKFNYILCLFLVTLVILGCGDKKKSSLSNSDCFNFDSVVAMDYESLRSTYGEELRYFESQGKLAKPLYETTDSKVIWIKSVFAIKDTVIIITRDVKSPDVQVEKINSYWLEDQVTTPYNEVKLGDAINAINKSNIVRPRSTIFVVRRPLFPPFPDHNFYIFGDFGHSPFIQVDSRTGEVKINEF